MTRILMLGGDPDVVEAERTILVGKGYTVAMARDIPDELALRDHFKPDLVFVDATGHDLADAVELSVRTREGGLRVPTLIMGTKGRSVEFFTYADDGTIVPAPDFPEKPMEPAALLKNVRYALGMANTGG
jgi:DNA-binding response OmpR family regulator